jgi:hypothetical protein
MATKCTESTKVKSLKTKIFSVPFVTYVAKKTFYDFIKFDDFARGLLRFLPLMVEEG